MEEVSGFSGTTPTFQTVMTRTYDDLGRETKTTNADGKSVTTAYTQAPAGGLLTSVTTTNAKLHATTTHIDPAWGVPQAEIDPNSKRTDIVYDALGRVSKVWLPGQTMGGEPHNSEFAYDIRNDDPSTVTTKTRRNDGSYAVSYELYDGLLRSRQTQLPAPGGGRVIADTFYDSRGLVSKKHANYANSSPPGTTLFTPNGDEVPSATEFVYDGAARPVTETLLSRDNPLWHRSMDYGGDRVRVTPPKGETPVMTVTDIAGRTTELHQFKGETPTGDADVTTYTYNARGQLLTTTDPTTKNVWRNEYDVRGRVITVHDPDKGTSELTYDVLGRVATSKDARNKTLAYTYDELSRKTAMFDGSTAGTKLAEWTYDTLAKGQPTASTRYVDGLAYTHRVDTYNDHYQPTKATTVIPTKDGLTKYSTGTGTLAGSYQVSATYNFDGSLSGKLIPKAGDLAAEVFSYTYDLFGLPVRTKGSTDYVTNTVYSKTGQVLQQELTTGGPKTFRNFEYEDSTDRLKRAFTTRETAVAAPVSDVRYDYDAAGNVISVADIPADGTQADIQCYNYDYLRRLTNAWTAKTDCSTKPTAENAGTTVGGAAPYWHTYTYDAVGNRKTELQHGLGGAADTTRTYGNPAAGAAQPHTLSSVRTETPPANGQPGIDKLDEYVYDAAGNTVARKLNGNTQTLEWDAEGRLAKVTEGTKTTSFVYDADGNRLLRKDPTGTTLYLGEQEILLNASNGTLKGTRYISHGGGTVAVKTGSGVQWLVSDHHGTAQLSISSTAAVGQGVQRRYQDPFGNPRGQQPTSWPGEKGFVGGTIDSSTGLTHLGAREYDPTIGRFISVDPIIATDDPQQMHGYAYANNSPITFSDPSGLLSNPYLTPLALLIYGPMAPILAMWWFLMHKNGQNGNGGGGSAGPALNQQEQQQLDQARKVKQKSLTQVILETGGAVLLDVIGVTDIYNCVKGGVGACISAVAGAIPWYKIGKFAKAVYRAVNGVLTWMDQVKWADNVIKASEDKIAAAQAAAEQAANKADDAPDVAGKKQPVSQPDDGGGGATCRIPNSFTPETKVKMADGSSKDIKDVEVGDEVIATDPETGKTTKRKVVATIVGDGSKNLVEITVAGSADTERLAGRTTPSGDSEKISKSHRGEEAGAVIATDGHPFWVRELHAWVDATDLQPGMWLRTSAGTYVQVKAVRSWVQSQRVHNLTVDTDHTYYVEAGDTPVLVHNCGPNLADEAANLPKDYSRRSTGILDVGAEQIPLSSGPGGPSHLVTNLPGRTKQNFDHVETHAAAFLRSNPGIRKAVLYVENSKGQMCPGPNGCAANIEDMLPEGVEMWMYMNGNPYAKFIGNAN